MSRNELCSHIVLLRSRLRDQLELCRHLEQNGFTAYLVLGTYEILAEFRGKYEQLMTTLESDQVRQRIFAPRRKPSDSIIVLGLDGEPGGFPEGSVIRCYVFATFEHETDVEVGIRQLLSGGIECLRVRPLTSRVLGEFPHILAKVHFESMAALRRYLLNKLGNLAQQNGLELRTTTFMVL